MIAECFTQHSHHVALINCLELSLLIVAQVSGRVQAGVMGPHDDQPRRGAS